MDTGGNSHLVKLLIIRDCVFGTVALENKHLYHFLQGSGNTIEERAEKSKCCRKGEVLCSSVF